MTLRSKNKLHPVSEKNLKLILLELFPGAHPVGEINVDGGREDLNFFIPPSNKKVHFDILKSIKPCLFSKSI